MSALVSLVPVRPEDRDLLVALEVAPSQRSFVAPNAKTIDEAARHPEAWLRAIHADGDPVGLLLLHDEHLRSDPRQQGYYFLWRLMIGAPFQGMGHGRRAVELLVEHVRTRPFAEVLLTSCVPGAGSAEGFYQALGFERTGQRPHGEVELVLTLGPA